MRTVAEDPAGILRAPASVGGNFPWCLLLLQGAVALVLGAHLLASPVRTLMVIVTFLGAYWLVSGLFTLGALVLDRADWAWKVVTGLLGILIGIVILAYPLYSTFVVPFVFTVMVGVLAQVEGLVALYGGFTGQGWGVGALGVLSIVFGLLVLAEPVAATVIVPCVFGIFGIVLGFAAIVGAFMARSVQTAERTAT